MNSSITKDRIQRYVRSINYLPPKITSPPTGTSLAPATPEPAHSNFKVTGAHPPSLHTLVSNLACVAFVLIHLESGGAVGGPPEVRTASSEPGGPPAVPYALYEDPQRRPVRVTGPGFAIWIRHSP